MKALERIKYIKKIYIPESFGGNMEQMGGTFFESGHYDFLLRAVEVMRSVAINSDICGKKHEPESVDEEFNSRMSQSEKTPEDGSL